MKSPSFSTVAAALITCVFLLAPATVSLAASQASSGLPLPRFVSLRADEVNMRTGPGVQYPVEWVYMRKELPVEIIAEFETWRKVRDWEGSHGWIHQSMLSIKRTILITGDVRILRATDDAKSVTIARIEPGVVARLVDCPKGNGWCRIEAAGRAGWLRHVDFWGAYKNEVFD
jgi:SH3-like domain-containing protein